MTSLGTYKVKDKSFSNKLLALIYASEQKLAFEDVVWDFYTDKFLEFQRSRLASPLRNVDLKSLYKQRAQQLRDKYDYLALQYSGGSDSWMILDSFLANNIPLDEIVVRYPVSVVEKFAPLFPATLETSDYLYEWKMLLQHDLADIAQKHPKIKINVIDWIADLPQTELINDKNIWTNHWIDPVTITNARAIKLLGGRRSVGMIWGIDKPLLYLGLDNKCYMFFADSALNAANPNIGAHDDAVLEPFYWTPDFPVLAFAEAYRMYQWFKYEDKALITLGKSWFERTSQYRSDNRQEYNNLCVKLLRPQYDRNRFQAKKAVLFDFKNSKCPWAYELPEFQKHLASWRYCLSSYLTKIDDCFFITDVVNGQRIRSIFKATSSKLFYIGDF